MGWEDLFADHGVAVSPDYDEEDIRPLEEEDVVCWTKLETSSYFELHGI